MVPPRTNFFSFLKPWANNSSTNQYSYQLFYGWRTTHLVPSYLKNAFFGEAPGELQPWGVSLISNPFWHLCQKLSLFFTLTKLCTTNALEWSSLVPGPKAKSSSEIKNLTLFTASYQNHGVFRVYVKDPNTEILKIFKDLYWWLEFIFRKWW